MLVRDGMSRLVKRVIGLGLLALILYGGYRVILSPVLYAYLNHYAIDYYIETASQINSRKVQNISESSVFFYGDSLVQALAVQVLLPRSINLGVGHATTAVVLDHVKAHSGRLKDAAAVFVSVGINDISNGTHENIIRNYNLILNELPDGIPVIVSLIFPVDENALDKKGLLGDIREVNRALLTICDSRELVYCLLPGEVFFDDEGGLREELHVGDGLHLNGKANSLWLKEISKLLEDVVGE